MNITAHVWGHTTTGDPSNTIIEGPEYLVNIAVEGLLTSSADLQSERISPPIAQKVPTIPKVSLVRTIADFLVSWGIPTLSIDYLKVVRQFFVPKGV